MKIKQAIIFPIIFLFITNCFGFQVQNSNFCISIITSIYKGDKFIKGFMEDIIKQTIFDRCELILINANSPDNEEVVITPYLEQYSNIIYVKLDHDPGLYAVWNIAITMARGKYITNANIDDRLAYNCYELHAQALDGHPEVDLIYSDIYRTHKPNETFYNHTGKPYFIYPAFSPKRMSICLPNNHPMWRKSMHEKHGIFNEKYKCGGDYEMWLRAVRGGAKFLKVNKILGLYYDNPKGISTSKETISQATRESRQLRKDYRNMFS